MTEAGLEQHLKDSAEGAAGRYYEDTDTGIPVTGRPVRQGKASCRTPVSCSDNHIRPEGNIWVT